MDVLAQLQPGIRLYDRHTGRERLIQQVEPHGRVVFLSFLNPQTGEVERQSFVADTLGSRFELLSAGTALFHGDPETVRLVAEAHRLQHAYLFNPVFATETSLIDLLPHQLAAVYGVPPTEGDPHGTPGMLDRPCLRFLLVDDTGADKTIMAGLREQVRRWLGWERIEQSDTCKLLTDLQRRELPQRKQEAATGLPEAVVGAYNILVAVDEDGRVQAQALRTGSTVGGTPFERIKSMLVEDERLLATTLDPDLILPGSYLEIWRPGETARRMTDLMAAFGQFPRLPRLLRPAALYDTLVRGVRAGMLVLRLFELDPNGGPWPCSPVVADQTYFREVRDSAHARDDRGRARL